MSSPLRAARLRPAHPGDASCSATVGQGVMPTFELRPVIVPTVLREVIAERGSIWVRAVGQSMRPTIHDDDRVLLSRISEVCRPGDVVAVDRGEFLVLHRVIAVRDGLVRTRGDACLSDDAAVPLERVVARALAMQRGERVTALRYTLRFRGVALLRLLRSRGRMAIIRWRSALPRTFARRYGPSPGDGERVADVVTEESTCSAR